MGKSEYGLHLERDGCRGPHRGENLTRRAAVMVQPRDECPSARPSGLVQWGERLRKHHDDAIVYVDTTCFVAALRGRSFRIAVLAEDCLATGF